MPVRRLRGYRRLMEIARSPIKWLICKGLSLPFAIALSSPAYAQLAGSIALSSNEMFRGETISANDPALSLSLSLDDESGLFAGVAGSVAVGNSDPRMTYASQYAGYAKRFGETSIEAGIIHRTYERVVDTEYRKDFVDIYAGVTHRSLKARIYVSPNYRRDNRASYYGEINARLIGVGEWSLDAHAGLSVQPEHQSTGSNSRMQTYPDWRLQVSRPVGKLFLSAGVAATNYPVYSPNGQARIFASASYAF